jgi:hypothetical protein
MNLAIEQNQLRIELEWFEQLWAFHLNKTITIPLTHITHVTTDEPRSSWAELRAPGTCLPGVIKAGTYYTRQGKEFWYVTSEKDYLTLDLHNEPYQRIVLTLNDSAVWAEHILSRIH